MNESDDIARLFKHFGGEASQYQEIGRINEARVSRERWPLLFSIDPDRATQAPPVDAAASAPSGQSGEPRVLAQDDDRAPRAAQAAVSAAPVRGASQPAQRPEARVEPWIATPPAPPAAPAKPDAAPPEQALPSARRSEAFVAPQPERLRTRGLPPVLARTTSTARPAAQAPVQQPAPAPQPSAAGAAPAPLPTPPAAGKPQPAAELTGIFSRLSDSAAPQTAAAEDRRASLLERLNRL